MSQPDDLEGVVQEIVIDIDPGHVLRKKLDRPTTWFLSCLYVEGILTYLHNQGIDYLVTSTGNWQHIRIKTRIDQQLAEEFAEQVLTRIDPINMNKQRIRRDYIKPTFLSRVLATAIGLRVKLLYSEEYIKLVKGLGGTRAEEVIMKYTLNDYRERPWVESIRERGLAYPKKLVREAMLGEGVERADEVESRIMENCIREAVHYRPIRREWVREEVGEKVRAVKKQRKGVL